MEGSIKHSFWAIIVALLIMQAKSSENQNQNTKEALDQSTQSEMHNPLMDLILAERERNTTEFKHNSRVKRQFGIGYGGYGGYYDRGPYYPLPIIIGGGFFGPGFGRGYGFGGRGFGGRGFGGRGIGGRGFGGRGGGIGGRGGGIGGGRGGGGGGGGGRG